MHTISVSWIFAHIIANNIITIISTSTQLYIIIMSFLRIVRSEFFIRLHVYTLCHNLKPFRDVNVQLVYRGYCNQIMYHITLRPQRNIMSTVLFFYYYYYYHHAGCFTVFNFFFFCAVHYTCRNFLGSLLSSSDRVSSSKSGRIQDRTLLYVKKIP